ncbi:collagen alpha-1(XIX) chain-like [Pseudonaja textilis]|uniref:collagen alpha-1(XIX) chain-like n=1 Tax=Pseudonaja textilis TaxID=8673 RepID=UPI000EAA4CE4|nr:collagen alpha-1(XIX) chain-like [Pseudonaja textilis]
MILYCDPSLAAQENCCELSEHVHPLEKNLKTTAASPLVDHIGKIQALPIMEKNPEEKCFCSQNKGETGLPGVASLPGQKGEKWSVGLGTLLLSYTVVKHVT